MRVDLYRGIPAGTASGGGGGGGGSQTLAQQVPLVLDISALKFKNCNADGAALAHLDDWSGVSGFLITQGTVTLAQMGGPGGTLPAFAFASGDAYTAESPIPNGPPGFSATVLVKATSLSSVPCLLAIGAASWSGDGAMGLLIQASGSIILGTQGAGHSRGTPDGTFTTGAWHRITVCYSGGNFGASVPRFWLDGVEVITNADGGAWTSQPNLTGAAVYVGGIPGGGNYLAGSIADLKILSSGSSVDALIMDAYIKTAWGLAS